MEDLLQDWAAVAAHFVIVGLIFEALKRTIRAKAGDFGLKGVWYVWKRVFILPLGMLSGLSGALMQVPNIFGEGMGPGVLSGVIGAGIVAFAYDMIVGSFKSRAKHLLAK